ncbi:MAG: M55 family metallopeptidase [Spirochaetales bacterium]|nr:M55 family metallopeptidase [Spirochaetales bacterium]
MKPLYKSIFIISDIEGSSGCWNRKASAFKTKEWADACVDMSLDVNSLVTALFEAGVEDIRIKDFHRTGYNLIPELIDKRAELILGYKATPIPGVGDPGHATGLMMIGMHASSGRGGFISHTLTSRIKNLECNGRLLSEAELVSMVLAPYGISPLFFSGCPVACEEARGVIPHILTYPIDKSIHPDNFSKEIWRQGLQKSALQSIENNRAVPFFRGGPFRAVMTMRDGPREAENLAKKWHLPCEEDKVMIESPTPDSLFNTLLKVTYLTPVIEKILSPGLSLFHLYGKAGQRWVYSRLKKEGKTLFNR